MEKTPEKKPEPMGPPAPPPVEPADVPPPAHGPHWHEGDPEPGDEEAKHVPPKDDAD